MKARLRSAATRLEIPHNQEARRLLLFEQDGGEFAFDCLTGSIHGACDGNAVEFTWDGNDEMEEANGHGWAELQDDGSLKGEICLECGDDIPFIARCQESQLNRRPGGGFVLYCGGAKEDRDGYCRP